MRLIFELPLRFPDVETNLGPRCPVTWACRILCSNVQDLSKNLSDVTVALSQYDLLRPWSRTGFICQSCWFLDLVIQYCCARMEFHGPVGWLHMCDIDIGHFVNQNLSVAVVRCWYSVCGARQNFYLFSLLQPCLR